MVCSPSDAPYTAAARPAGPPPTMQRSYSGCSRARAAGRAHRRPRASTATAAARRRARARAAGRPRSAPASSCSRRASSSRSRSSHRYGTWLRARKVLISWLRSDQRWPTTRTSSASSRVLVLPVAQQVVEDRVQPLLGRVPRLEQVVVEPDVVDRLDRDVGVGVGREQHELGVRGAADGPAPGTRRRSSPASAGPTAISGDAAAAEREARSTSSASAPDLARRSGTRRRTSGAGRGRRPPTRQDRRQPSGSPAWPHPIRSRRLGLGEVRRGPRRGPGQYRLPLAPAASV